MRTLLFASAILLGTGSIAQTYYYVNAISVTPPSPTTADAIMITLEGDLSNTAAYIVNTAFSVNGATVNITVGAGVPGIGLAVLVPHSESFAIGQLPAGTYTIVINGTSTLDLAPVPQHTFTVTGGTGSVCDSVIIDYVRWQAFTDTALEVHVFNTSTNCFDYPGFLLLQGTDTVAQEITNFFCVPPEGTHLLMTPPGTTPPVGPFTGELQLWTGFYTELACTFPFEGDLCPPEPCTEVHPFLDNFGNALVNATIPWTIIDGDGGTVDTGSFFLDADEQSDHDTVCLSPGNYSLVLSHEGPLGGQLVFGMTFDQPYGITASANYLQGSDINTLPFTFFGPCIDDDNGIIYSLPSSGPHMWLEGNAVMVTTMHDRVIGNWKIVDAMGRQVSSGRVNDRSGAIRVDHLSTGTYVLNLVTGGSFRFVH